MATLVQYLSAWGGLSWRLTRQQCDCAQRSLSGVEDRARRQGRRGLPTHIRMVQLHGRHVRRAVSPSATTIWFWLPRMPDRRARGIGVDTAARDVDGERRRPSTPSRGEDRAGGAVAWRRDGGATPWRGEEGSGDAVDGRGAIDWSGYEGERVRGTSRCPVHRG